VKSLFLADQKIGLRVWSPWICLALLVSLAAAAQEEPHAPQAVRATTENSNFYTLRAESRQVIVAASVYNHKHGETWPPPARGLSAKNFHILDNGAEQSINYFQEADFPTVDVTWFFGPTIGGTWGTRSIGEGVALAAAIYLIGYVPPALNPGECRTVQALVKDRYVYLNRNRYCDPTASDVLDRATLEGITLFTRMRSFADSSARGSMKVSTQAFTFWSSGVLSLARETSPTGNGPVLPAADYTYVVEVHDSKAPATVQIATEFTSPKKTVDCRNKPNSPVAYVLGMVYKANGQVARQFASHETCPTVPWLQGQNLIPTRFYTQIELQPGDYEARVVVSDGKSIGQARVPLHVEPFDSHRLMISDVVFGEVVRDASWVVRDAAEVSPAPIIPSPLVSNKVEVFPATNTSFPKSDHLPLYFELYEPQRIDQNTAVSFTVRVTDLKSGSVVMNMERINTADWVQPGHAVIPIGMKLPTAKLKKGSYRLEVRASDSAGRVSEWREATFTLE
jgi:hypothetical protein